MARVMTVRDLREALAGAPDWRPVTLGIETADRELVVDLDLVEDHGRFEDGEVTLMLAGREVN
jgi:hypothetical protein